MKKITVLLIAASLMLLLFSACSDDVVDFLPEAGDDTTVYEETTVNTDSLPYDYSALPNEMLATDGKYELAFITNGDGITDGSINQGSYEGLKRYAREHKADYKYYIPANGTSAGPDDITAAVKTAADGGAIAIVCSGSSMWTAVEECADDYPGIGFFFIDGYKITGSDGDILNNVAIACFREEQAGFMAGYSAVTDGRTSLGYYGTASHADEKMSKYGYGFLQGADYAAAQLGITVNMKYSYSADVNFNDAVGLQSTMEKWFSDGVQSVFVQAGELTGTAIKSAEKAEREIIAADFALWCEKSDSVLTVAAKSYRNAVYSFLNHGYGSFSSVAGILTYIDAREDGLYLPTEQWRFTSFSLDDYNALFTVVADGTAVIKGEETDITADMFPNLAFSE